MSKGPSDSEESRTFAVGVTRHRKDDSDVQAEERISKRLAKHQHYQRSGRELYEAQGLFGDSSTSIDPAVAKEIGIQLEEERQSSSSGTSILSRDDYVHTPTAGSRISDSDSSNEYQIPQHSRPSEKLSLSQMAQANANLSPEFAGGATLTRTPSGTTANLGRNRLTTGFHPRRSDIGAAAADSDAIRNPSPRASPGNLVMEISDDSDDSDVMDDSEGGIMLNIDEEEESANGRASEEVEYVVISDDEEEDEEEEEEEEEDDDDMEVDDDYNDNDENGQDHAEAYNAEAYNASQNHYSHDTIPQNNHRPASGNTISHAAGSMFQIDVRPRSRILADLKPNELEEQIKYALFQLRRDQIDLSRPAVCLNCLQEGHSEDYCPGLLCTICGGQTLHPRGFCPNRTRCPSCGARGHGREKCRENGKNGSKSRQNNDADPCAFCQACDHSESSCIQRFFPARIRSSKQLSLWISCAQCGSKEHLAGDCSASPKSKAAPTFAQSLRGYNLAADQFINLSLQRGIQAQEKEAESKGLRPEGPLKGDARSENHRRGRGKGGPYPRHVRASRNDRDDDDDNDDDDFTTRLSSQRHDSRPQMSRNGTRPQHGGSGRDYRDDHYQLRMQRWYHLGDYQPPRRPRRSRSRSRSQSPLHRYSGDRAKSWQPRRSPPPPPPSEPPPRNLPPPPPPPPPSHEPPGYMPQTRPSFSAYPPPPSLTLNKQQRREKQQRNNKQNSPGGQIDRGSGKAKKKKKKR